MKQPSSSTEISIGTAWPYVRWFPNAETGALPCPAREVHLWTWEFENIQDYSILHTYLSREESIREQTFATAELRKRYAMAHGKLRRLLGRYLSCPPGRVKLVTLPWGKPCLLEGRLFFNMSHTDKRIVIAVSANGPVGVDVEELRPVPEAASIAQRWFSRQEIRWIEKQHTPGIAFLRCWVRREALLKAVGSGICMGMDSLALPAPSPHFTMQTRNRTIHVRELQHDEHCVHAVAACTIEER